VVVSSDTKLAVGVGVDDAPATGMGAPAGSRYMPLNTALPPATVWKFNVTLPLTSNTTYLPPVNDPIVWLASV
jgi:hypothetical protein